MKTLYIIGALFICIGASLYLRIGLPYEHVFTGEWIKFSGTDAYWQMSYVDRVAPDFPSYILQIFKIPFFVWLLSGVIWCVGLGSPSQHTIDTVGAYFPTVLAALTVIPVYFIGKEMFGRIAGLVAAILIAILPGEWLGRSILGFTDHHVMEVLLSTTTLMFLIMALKAEEGKQLVYIVPLGLCLGLYLRTSLIGVIFVIIIAAYLCTQIILNLLKHRKDFTPILLLAMGWAATIALYVTEPKLFSDAIRMMGALNISGAQAITTLEMRPLFFPSGYFTYIVAWASFGFIALLVPVAIAGLSYRAVRDADKGTVLLVVWSLATLVLMLLYRRFAYYFAVNAALLTGWFIWYIWRLIKVGIDMSFFTVGFILYPLVTKVFKSKIVGIIIMIAVIAMFVAPNAQNAVASAKYPPYTPSDAWCSTLDWVEENTPETSVILAWWDYGYWINRMAKREAYVNPSQDKKLVTETASMMLSGEIVEADYIILDHATTNAKMWAIATWAGKQHTDFSNTFFISKEGKLSPVLLFYPEYYQSLAVRLYNFDGKVVIPTQSTVINYNPSDMILNNVDTYATYAEAQSHLGLGQRLVGTSPFISPVPLEAEERHTLVYESEQKINGVAEVKVFKAN